MTSPSRHDCGDLRVLPSFRAVVPCLWIAVTVAGSSWRTWSFLGAQFIVRAIIMFAVGVLVGNVPDPWLFSTASSETIPTLQPVVRRPQDAHRRNITAFSDL